MKNDLIPREQAMGWLMALLIVAGGVIGGGPTSPVLSMFVELIACALLVLALAGIVDRRYPEKATPALVLLVLICLVPLVQLIPMPAAWWRGLPGHGIAAQIASVAGLSDEMRPLSLDPEQTRLALLSLIVPIAAFAATLQLGVLERDRLILIVVGFALLSALLGVFQVSQGGGLDLGIYRHLHDGYAIGFFANRNHEADLLLIAIPFSAHLIAIRPWSRQRRTVATIVTTLFFAAAVVSTISRGGLLLLPVAIVGAFVVRIGDIRDRRVMIGAGAVVAMLALSYLVLTLTPLGSKVLMRFDQVSEDLRPHIWEGSIAAIKDFWPLGSGVGSFVPTYKMYEDLNAVIDAWVNHAHNDFLELLLVAGVPAAILMVAYLVLTGIALLSSLPTALRRQRYAAVTAILILLGHSLVDYPLRTSILITLFAFSHALLFLPKGAVRVRRSGSHPVSPQPSFVAEVPA